MDPQRLGRRIKRVRESRHLTLKAIETAAGISATHVSEIERGKTSPTIGVLLRIAAALRTDPAFFLEEEELQNVSVVASEDRVRASLPGSGGTAERLTTSVPGGILQAVRFELAPGGRRHAAAHEHRGEEAALVTAGAVRFVVGDQSFDLAPGDTIHYDATLPHTFSNPSRENPAAVLWFSDARDAE
jgi:transcriptional regulator with XRE-family HTH domain